MKSYNDLFPKDIKHNIRELADKLPFLPEIIKKCKGSDESLKSLRQATQERNIALEKEKENYSQKIASNLNEQRILILNTSIIFIYMHILFLMDMKNTFLVSYHLKNHRKNYLQLLIFFFK